MESYANRLSKRTLNRDPYRPDPKIGRVRHLYVLLDHRRLGVGRALVEMVVDHARARFSALRLWTDRAGSFYERIGFRPVSEDRATHRLDMVAAQGGEDAMNDADAPYHAHIYYADAERGAAETLREQFSARERAGDEPRILFVGRMVDHAVGPHPIPQYEIHFPQSALPHVIAAIEASGLRALVHPLTDDDLADHTSLAHWIGEPVELDVSVLDPPGMNQGVARFGKTDF